MKIGILSINFHTKGLNFACPIHTYAFQQFLLKHGIENVVIDYLANYYNDFEPRHPYDYYAEKYDALLKKEVSGDAEKEQREIDLARIKKKRDGYRDVYKEREVRYDKFQQFIDTHYIKTDFCYNSDLLEVMDPEFDCYICATDVVWKNQIKDGFDRGYFLGSKAMENKWKFAYSVSRGIPGPYTEKEQKEFFGYLEDIDFISVRENSLKNFIEENSDLKVRVDIDPVFLRGRELYDEIAVKPQEENYILLYYAEGRPKNALKKAVRYAREHHLKIVELTELPIKDGLVSAYKDVESIFRYDIGPDEWLGYIKYAECIFTNSFHGTCFSIIYEKDFFVGSRSGDKIAHLLGKLGLSDRMLADEKQAKKKQTHSKIYVKLKNLLSKKQREFIKNLISGKKEDSKKEYGEKIDYSIPRMKLAQMRKESEAYILETIHYMEQHKRPEREYETRRKMLSYPILYNSTKMEQEIIWDEKVSPGKLVKLESNSWEFAPEKNLVRNDGSGRFIENGFRIEKYLFRGWCIRLKIDNHWFWYLEDGTLKLKNEYQEQKDGLRKVFKENDTIPYIPVNRIAVMVAEAIWEEESCKRI